LDRATASRSANWLPLRARCGSGAGASNTAGNENTALGTSALFTNSTGGYNTATGSEALAFNTTGSNNTASGAYALQSNTTGGGNTASGYDFNAALHSRTPLVFAVVAGLALILLMAAFRSSGRCPLRA